MEKRKSYSRTRFTADVIREALATFRSQFDPESTTHVHSGRLVSLDDAEWNHDTDEEFLVDYHRSQGRCVLTERWARRSLSVDAFPETVHVEVASPSRGDIEAVFHVFEKHAQSCRLPEPPRPSPPASPQPVIFVGHGRSPLWRDLKDHLHEKHGYQIEAYEIGARAGMGIWDVLDGMLVRSSVAILVMTGEDETADGRLLARQNVVHETGLFQGRLGAARAIVLLEDGTEEFSNIHGVNQIRFSRGAIRETYGEVLATLKREFPHTA